MDMNLNLSHSANELADWLVYFTQDAADYEEKNVLEAAAMLRQQQAEIEVLKAHPVKELTDEEIKQLANEYLFVDEDELAMLFVGGSVDFAKAILKKAKEK